MSDIRRITNARRIAVAWRYDVPLVAGLTVLWALLWGSWSVLTLLCGLVVALLVTQLLPLPPVPLSKRFSLPRAVWFLAVWAGHVVVASFRVAWAAVRPRGVRLPRRRLLIHVLDTERPEQVDQERRTVARIEELVIRAIGSKQDVSELAEPLPEVTR